MTFVWWNSFKSRKHENGNTEEKSQRFIGVRYKDDTGKLSKIIIPSDDSKFGNLVKHDLPIKKHFPTNPTFFDGLYNNWWSKMALNEYPSEIKVAATKIQKYSWVLS